MTRSQGQKKRWKKIPAWKRKAIASKLAQTRWSNKTAKERSEHALWLYKQTKRAKKLSTVGE